MPLTLASHASMFTGLYPEAHGAVDHDSTLPVDRPVLAEHLSEAGFAVAGVHTNDFLRDTYGFSRGFDTYEQLEHQLTYADRVTRRALELLEDLEATGRPYFLFVHYMDPHSDVLHLGSPLPYYSPSELRSDLAQLNEQDSFCLGDDCATGYLQALDRQGISLTSTELALLRELYERGVRYLDRELRPLLEALSSPDRQDVLVIITSDHGEEFREHGRLIHVQPYEETLRVPLLVRLPGARLAGTRRNGLASSVDLFPTILEAVGEAARLAETPLQGRSLWPLIEEGRPIRRLHFGQDKNRPHRAVLRTSSYSLLLDEMTGETQLFDLQRDPGERHDIASDHPELAATMASQLTTLRRRNRQILEDGRSGRLTLSSEEVRRLRSLGYTQ